MKSKSGTSSTAKALGFSEVVHVCREQVVKETEVWYVKTLLKASHLLRSLVASQNVRLEF